MSKESVKQQLGGHTTNKPKQDIKDPKKSKPSKGKPKKTRIAICNPQGVKKTKMPIWSSPNWH